MIKLFRNIRKSFLRKNQLGQYFKYAIGEIFLVVIGILIALQINNWNENNKKERLKTVYVSSLVSDLSLDTLLLGKLIAENTEILNKLILQQKRFLGPNTPIDTLVKIARDEFNPELNLRFKYNRNTINTLISSGNIDLFSQDFNKIIMELISTQDIERENSKFYAEVYTDKISRFSDDFPVSGRQNSKIFNSVWDNVDENEIASRFISLTDIKGFSHYTFIENIIKVKEQTSAVIQYIKSSNK